MFEKLSIDQHCITRKQHPETNAIAAMRRNIPIMGIQATRLVNLSPGAAIAFYLLVIKIRIRHHIAILIKVFTPEFTQVPVADLQLVF